MAGVQAAPGGAQSLVVDSAKWAAFRDWFAKGMRTLKQARPGVHFRALSRAAMCSTRGRPFCAEAVK